MPSQPAQWSHSRQRQHATHGLLLLLGAQRLETRHGDFQVHVFQHDLEAWVRVLVDAYHAATGTEAPAGKPDWRLQ